MLDILLVSKSKVMVSGYASSLYDQKLSGWERVELKSQAESGRAVTEVVWMNYYPPKGSYVQQQLKLDD